MKILEVNTEKIWRGGERQTYYNIKGFLNLGVETTLLTLKGTPLAQRVSDLGVNIIEVKNNLDAYIYLCSKGKEYDVIHAQTAKAQSLAVFSKPFHNRPVVYTRRVAFAPKGILSKLKYKNTDKIVAVTDAVRKILERQFQLKGIIVIPDAVEPKKLNVDRAKKIRQKYMKKKIIATTSALTPEKDPVTMVKAIKELTSLRNDFVFLHFGDGPLKESVEELIQKLGIEDFYKIMGFVEDVEDFFAIFDVFVMSSKSEGSGSSVLDAFVYKVPVVSTDADGLKELIGDCGLLCKAGDYKCLATSINRILNDSNLRNSLIEKAFQKAISDHSIDKVAKEYVKIFKFQLHTAD